VSAEGRNEQGVAERTRLLGPWLDRVGAAFRELEPYSDRYIRDRDLPPAAYTRYVCALRALAAERRRLEVEHHRAQMEAELARRAADLEADRRDAAHHRALTEYRPEGWVADPQRRWNRWNRADPELRRGEGLA